MDENQTDEYPILSPPYSEEGIMAELDRSLDYLQKHSDIPKLVDSEHGYRPIKTLYYIVSLNLFHSIQNKETIFESYNSYEVFANILDYLTSKLDELDFVICSPNSRWLNKDLLPTKNERRIFILIDLIAAINHLIPSSIKLRLFFLNKKRLRYFSDLISNQNFLVNGVKYDFQLLKSTIFDINWLSKSAENNKSEWKELNIIKHLINSLKVTEKLKLYIFMAIANIADDKEIEEFVEIQTSIDTFVGLANQTANNILNGTVERSQQQFPDEDNNQKILIYDVALILDTNINATITITGTLLAIYRLSINPKSKLNIYNKFNFKESLKCLLSYGNEIEQLYSIEVLAQLTFDGEVLNDIMKDSKLCDLIKQKSIDEKIKIEKLKKICKQILWSIEENKTKVSDEDMLKKSNYSNGIDDGHIMISYNTGSRDVCLRIKDELEKDNHKVWIDVSEIHGSSLDSMAKAVENATIVLMCVTEKYRQSLNCQAEAQYSFRLKKNIIPCIMQKGYHNVDGWLGFIIGDKIFIDFSKYSFEDSIKRLKNQISFVIDDKKSIKIPTKKEAQTALAPMSIASPTLVNNHNDTEVDTKVIKIILNQPKNDSKQILTCENAEKINTWNEQQVNDWFTLINLRESSIYKTLYPCKGELLTQLYEIQLHAPEFFFKSISNNNSNLNDLKNVALFSVELKKLFFQN